MNPFGGFRLYELLSVFNLARLTSFDAALFQTLSERFLAHDAVRLINTLAEAFLGEAALPEQAAPARSAIHFAEHLVYGGWVALQQTDDWLRMRGIEEMLDQIGANDFPANVSLNGKAVPRLLMVGRQDHLLAHLDLAWDIPNATLHTCWHLATGNQTDGNQTEAEYTLLVHFGYDSYVEATLDTAGVIRTVTQKSDYVGANRNPVIESTSASSHRIIRLACPVPAIPKWPRDAGLSSLPVFLAMRRLTVGDECTKAAFYFPIRLRQEF